MVGTCRFSTCQSALGTEYRFRCNGRSSTTILCREHEAIVDAALRDPDRSLRVMVSPEGWVYMNIDQSDIRHLSA